MPLGASTRLTYAYSVVRCRRRSPRTTHRRRTRPRKPPSTSRSLCPRSMRGFGLVFLRSRQTVERHEFASIAHGSTLSVGASKTFAAGLRGPESFAMFSNGSRPRSTAIACEVRVALSSRPACHGGRRSRKRGDPGDRVRDDAEAWRIASTSLMTPRWISEASGPLVRKLRSGKHSKGSNARVRVSAFAFGA